MLQILSVGVQFRFIQVRREIQEAKQLISYSDYATGWMTEELRFDSP